MAKLAIVVAMLLVQVQPVAGAVLCERHHEQPAPAFATTTEHHQPGTGHGEGFADLAGDEQCATNHACAAATPVIRADATAPGGTPEYAVAGCPPTGARAASGLRCPPFHPPKS
jgi:hypothetical protein